MVRSFALSMNLEKGKCDMSVTQLNVKPRIHLSNGEALPANFLANMPEGFNDNNLKVVAGIDQTIAEFVADVAASIATMDYGMFQLYYTRQITILDRMLSSRYLKEAPLKFSYKLTAIEVRLFQERSILSSMKAMLDAHKALLDRISN